MALVKTEFLSFGDTKEEAVKNVKNANLDWKYLSIEVYDEPFLTGKHLDEGQCLLYR